MERKTQLLKTNTHKVIFIFKLFFKVQQNGENNISITIELYWILILLVLGHK